MRLPLLTLILGIVLGLVTYPFFVDGSRHLVAAFTPKPPSQKSAALRLNKPARPYTPVPLEKVLPRFTKEFDEAVIVVLGDESYDDEHHLVRLDVLEVWKGPIELAGRTLNTPLAPPLSYSHSKKVERVLRFMPMTPRINSGGSIMFEGNALRMNPAMSVDTLKEALVNRTRT